MSLEIEIGEIDGEWRAAAYAEGELLARARGENAAEARAALMAVLGGAVAPPRERISALPPISRLPELGGSPNLHGAISAVLRSHPEVIPHDQCRPETAKMHRYRTRLGRSIAHEHDHAVQHLWVAAVGIAGLEEIPSKPYPGANNGAGRHSNLRAMPDLRDADLIRYSPIDAVQARRIVDAVAKLAAEERSDAGGKHE